MFSSLLWRLALLIIRIVATFGIAGLLMRLILTVVHELNSGLKGVIKASLSVGSGWVTAGVDWLTGQINKLGPKKKKKRATTKKGS